jgi:hypothetical protein
MQRAEMAKIPHVLRETPQVVPAVTGYRERRNFADAIQIGMNYALRL